MKAILLPIVLAVAAAQAGAATNLVTNGSFELGGAGLGSFQGWQVALGDASTFVDSSGQTGTHYGQASDGLWAAYLGSTAADGGAVLSQVLSTTAGQAYQLSFDLANDNGGLAASNGLTVTLGGSTALVFSNLANQDYRTATFTFVATGTSTTLAFAAFNDASWLELDHVSVSAVPEPATQALTLAGLLSLGLVARARRGR